MKTTKQTVTAHQQLLTSRQAAKWLGLCERSLWSLAHSGEIPTVKMRRSVRYDVDDLRAYVASRKVGAK